MIGIFNNMNPIEENKKDKPSNNKRKNQYNQIEIRKRKSFEAQIKNDSFEFLPKRIIKKILRYADSKTRKSCKLVCRSWKRYLSEITSVKTFLGEFERGILERMIDSKNDLKNFELEKNHPQLKDKMRRITFEWFVEVQNEFQMSERALFISWDCFDRFLSLSRGISKDCLQLFGICSVWISSKFEDTHHKGIGEIKEICDNTYSEEEIIKAEKTFLNVLNWEIYSPNIFILCCEYLESLDEWKKECIESLNNNQQQIKSWENVFLSKVPHMINYLCSICFFYSREIFPLYSSKYISSSIVYLSLYMFGLIKRSSSSSSFLSFLQLSFEKQKFFDCIEKVLFLYKVFVSRAISCREKQRDSSIFTKFSHTKYSLVSLYDFSLLTLNLF
eukprot:TRINITY_DN8505_c0_g1_i1.p1 TRINITY_DN8505_c0_g1~~TRINITY_DN8505_c0_g1_i1.p1  ORF type:complete len:388 (-),score=106.88 TRINITY_DN8505_c0_g1_i1:32-1195(-)